MMNVLLRVSDAIDAVRQRAGRNVFWLMLVAGLAAAVVVPLYLFQESAPVAVRQPVSSGEVRPAAPSAPPRTAPVAQAPAPAPAPAAAPAPAVAPAPAAPAPAPAANATSGDAPLKLRVAPMPPKPAAPAASAPAQAPTPAAAAPAPKPEAPQPLVLSDSRKPEATAPAAGAEPQRLYQVQIGAFSEEPRAHRLAQRAAKEGFPAVVIQVTVAGDKVLHRVRLRQSLPKEQADALRASVRQKIPSLKPILAPAQ